MGILLESKDTRWRVNEYDLWQNDHYKKCRKIFDQYMQDTNTSAAPWYIVDAGDRKWAELQVLETMISNIEVAMENSKHAVPILQNVFPLMEMPRLSEIPLDGKEVGDEEYKAELKELQAKLGSLHNRLYRKRVPVIITYEAGMLPEREEISRGSRRLLIPVDLRYILSQVRSLMKKPVIICGVSGQGFPRMVTLPSLTGRGTEE